MFKVSCPRDIASVSAPANSCLLLKSSLAAAVLKRCLPHFSQRYFLAMNISHTHLIDNEVVSEVERGVTPRTCPQRAARPSAVCLWSHVVERGCGGLSLPFLPPPGESLPVTKTSLPRDCKSSQPWHLSSSEDSKRHLLFCGTDVIQARGADGGPARAVVLRTGG